MTGRPVPSEVKSGYSNVPSIVPGMRLHHQGDCRSAAAEARQQWASAGRS